MFFGPLKKDRTHVLELRELIADSILFLLHAIDAGVFVYDCLLSLGPAP